MESNRAASHAENYIMQETIIKAGSAGHYAIYAGRNVLLIL